ncbi:sushi, von Willebrand factor type A, EGF and pentraxin domain-containing protein 1-like [Mya arenaria]|uniref:sushi, von Willebrand factor type A, EGF and pentraxin domain-containing protein 1-like n=1 Tax=Mya arenaria TaxID=6604 RepID=UPI0022E035B4|nr:sushi, von Willebrand factor type A, EGF and pentraxin domain-containing protein 1-like [Mya arenaria]
MIYIDGEYQERIQDEMLEHCNTELERKYSLVCASHVCQSNNTFEHGTTFHQVANYSCELGFTLIGTDLRVCLENGTWNESEPGCELIECGLPPSLPHGSFRLPSGTVYLSTTFQQFAIYLCDLGFTLIGTYQRACLEDGTWNETEPVCELVDCGLPPALQNGSYSLSSGTVYLSHVFYSCDIGFTLSGNATIICTHTGIWNDTMPKCTLVDCGPVTAPVNGSVVINGGTTFHQVANYSCELGFTLIGTDLRVCLENGTWNESEPGCELIECGLPPSLPHGSFRLPSGTVYLSTTFQQFAIYLCDLGFTLIGTYQRACLEDGTWNETEPVCELVDCGLPPALQNGSYSLSSGTVYLSHVFYSCDIGFTLSGNATIICSHTGLWNGTVPQCTLVDCGSVTAPVNGSVVLSGGTTYGEVANFTCDDGFVITGSDSIRCNASGLWNASTPTCSVQGVVKEKLKPLYIMPCLCNLDKTFAGLTQEEIIRQLIENTTINRKNTSAYIYKHICREDNRPVSVATGLFSACVFSALLAVIVCSDVKHFLRHLRNYGAMFDRSR